MTEQRILTPNEIIEKLVIENRRLVHQVRELKRKLEEMGEPVERGPIRTDGWEY